MAALVKYTDFAQYNITWVEDNVADVYTSDYLKAARVSEEEIATAVPCHNPVVMTMEALARNVSELLRNFAHKFCTQVPERKFYFYLKHFGKKYKWMTLICVEISSVPLDSGLPFRIWFRYDIYNAKTRDTMISELNIMLAQWRKKTTSTK